MFFEAAAQASSAFLNEKKEGYVISALDTTLHVRPKCLDFDICVKKIFCSDTLNEMYFEAKENNTIVASGKILLMIQN
jgi:hypothetical protein